MMSNTVVAHHAHREINPEEVGHEVPSSIDDSNNDQGQEDYQQHNGMIDGAPVGSATVRGNTGDESPSRPQPNKNNNSVATLSSPWQYDEMAKTCSSCHCEFNPLNRRHHCRLCGKIFCHNCSSQRALVPPSSIVLVPRGGKKAKISNNEASFSPDHDPDRMLTYLSGGDANELLYGKGLEERFKLAREPLRVCKPCFQQLAPLQEDLRASNSNAMRFNHIDPTDARRLFNSPIAHTLGHEIRKAAYTLNNLLPQPRRMGALVPTTAFNSTLNQGDLSECTQCKEECSTISPNLGDWDGVRIPARLLEEAKGIAVMTVVKGGLGLAGFEFGTGLVVARTGEGGRWSAPSAIGTGGISWGALIGAQVSDHVFLLMNDASVHMLFSNKGSVQLGADVGIAVGPLGRAVEGNLGASVGNAVAPIYTYSLSKGLYAGISLDGKVICTRNHVNEKFYGRPVTGPEILAGAVPLPPAAQPLYEALARCHVYASQWESSHPHAAGNKANMNGLQRIQQEHSLYQQQHQQQRQQVQYNQFLDPEHVGLLSSASSAVVPPNATAFPQEELAARPEYGQGPYQDDHAVGIPPVQQQEPQATTTDSRQNVVIVSTTPPAAPHPEGTDAMSLSDSFTGTMSEITVDPGY